MFADVQVLRAWFGIMFLILLGGTLVYEHGVGVECRQKEEVMAGHV